MFKSSIDATESLHLQKLTVRIMADYTPHEILPLPAAYNFSETDSNDSSGFSRASMLLNSSRAEQILVCGAAGNGYTGPARAMQTICHRGGQIIAVPHEGPINTLSEARSMLAYVREQGWTSIGIIAPPFHIVRCMFTVVTAMGENWMRVFAFTGMSLSWNEEAVHSQGVLKKLRRDLLQEELERLKKYRAAEFGSLVDCTAMEQYLLWRDRT